MARKSTIRGSLRRVTVISTGLALLLAAAAHMLYDYHTYRGYMVRNLHALSGVIANGSAGALTIEDELTAQEILGSMEGHPRIVSACLYDADGNLFSEYQRDDGSASACQDGAPGHGHAFLTNFVGLMGPVELEGEIVGELYIASDLAELEERVETFFAMVLVITIFSMATAFLASTRLQGALTRPLFDLVRTARRISLERNYAIRAPKHRDDEIGQLAEGFNEMLEVVAERDSALAAARDEATAAAETKANFLANMSHEIRTPMNGVLGMAEMLGQSGLGGDQRAMLQTIQESGDSLLTIINDILDISKIEAGKLELETIAMSITDVVEGAAATLATNASRKGLGLVTYIEPDVPPLVMGDPIRVRQILFNLIGNAIKFTSEGEVTVRVVRAANGDADKASVRFQVIDQGIGIAEEAQAKLFQAFTQAEKETTRKYGGTGLGLAICQRLSTMMDGHIGVESSLGEGSVFTVTLPFVEIDERRQREAIDLSGLSVLVAGASDMLRAATSAYLSQQGASTQAQAETGIPVTMPDTDVIVFPDPHDSEAATAILAMEAPSPHVVLGRERNAAVATRPAVEGITLVDTNPMRRDRVVRAVAIAAGRLAPEVEETEAPAETKRALPGIDEALAEGRLILFAEDNETNQDVIRRQLNMLGFVCEIAGDGKAALEAWRSKPYGLLLTDCHMPIMDGYELTAAVRAEQPEGRRRTPIVAITADAMQGEGERCIAAGMDDYLSKPVAMPALLRVLAKWLPMGSEAPTLEPEATEAAAPLVSDAGSVVDPTFLRETFGEDDALIAEILGDYRGPAAKAMAEMAAAMESRSASEVAMAAHKLKSASRTIGANALAEFCRRLEDAGNAGDWQEIDAAYPDMTTAFSDVEAYIDAL